MHSMRLVAVLFKWLSELSFLVCAGTWVCPTGGGVRKLPIADKGSGSYPCTSSLGDIISWSNLIGS